MKYTGRLKTCVDNEERDFLVHSKTNTPINLYPQTHHFRDTDCERMFPTHAESVFRTQLLFYF